MSPHLLIFDSGVGGFSITEAIQEHLPHCKITYASDNAAFPYGVKQEEELIDRVDHVLHQLQQYSQADIIVIACNSASTIALPTIRQHFDCPIVGVVPAIKPAAKLSQTKVIGLLATPGTINRQYTRHLIQKFARNCQIISVGSSELVRIAENKLRGMIVDHDMLSTTVNPLRRESIDTVVLACTHFPLLKSELQLALPDICNWIDSASAVARRVEYWLQQLNLPTEGKKIKNHHQCLFTKSSDIDSLKPYIHKHGFLKIEVVDIND